MPRETRTESDRTQASHACPRPRIDRPRWVSPNGPWQFAIDADARWSTPGEVAWDRTIRVPFSPETPASGIGDTSPYAAAWSRRALPSLPTDAGRRAIPRFGAGCVVLLVEEGRAREVASRAATRWAEETGERPRVRVAEVSPLERRGGVECTVNRVGDTRFDPLRLHTARYPVLWERVAPVQPDRGRAACASS